MTRDAVHDYTRPRRDPLALVPERQLPQEPCPLCGHLLSTHFYVWGYKRVAPSPDGLRIVGNEPIYDVTVCHHSEGSTQCWCEYALDRLEDP